MLWSDIGAIFDKFKMIFLINFNLVFKFEFFQPSFRSNERTISGKLTPAQSKNPKIYATGM